MCKLMVVAAATVLTQTAQAQGYFDFGQIPGISRNPSVQVDLSPPMINFIREATRATDPAAADLIAGIENVRVRVYNVVDDVQDLFEFIDDTSGNLEREGWQRTIFVDEDEAKVRVYLKFDDTNATGLTVMVAGDDDEAVFINVSGLINPTQLGQLAQKYGGQIDLGGIDIGGALENAPRDGDD